MDSQRMNGVVEAVVEDRHLPFVHRARGFVQKTDDMVIEAWMPVLEVRIKTRCLVTSGVCVSL